MALEEMAQRFLAVFSIGEIAGRPRDAETARNASCCRVTMRAKSSRQLSGPSGTIQDFHEQTSM
jgi:hypothetical protein